MNEVLRFETNVPQQVALQYDPPGVLKEGRYGDQFLFSLVTPPGHVMYVPPVVGARIQALGVSRNEPFVVCKTAVKQGQRRGVEWKVQRLPPNGSGPEKPTGVPQILVASPAPQPVPQTVPADGRQPDNGAGPPQSPAPPPPASCASADPLGVASAFMLTALCAAIDVVNMAEKYATGKGIAVKFAGEDIRTIGNTLFIRVAGGGR